MSKISGSCNTVPGWLKKMTTFATAKKRIMNENPGMTSLNSKILALAIPNIITNITIPLLGMVDLGLMGHLGSENFLGAVALGTMIFSFIFWGFGFLRMGTSGFTAQSYGARNLAESQHILVRSLFIGFAAGLLLILLQSPTAYLAFRVIGANNETEALARQYFNIRIYAAPATLCIYSLTGWFIGMQNAKSPMILSISVNLLNILFSLCFIHFFGMKSDGIALANVLSQWTGLLLGFFLLRPYLKKLGKYRNYKVSLEWKAIGQFMKVNKDIFIRTLCLIFTLSFFTTKSANTSSTILAVNTLLFQFFYFFSYFVDGFAYAAEALTGKYTGARDVGMLHRIVKRLFTWGLLISIAFTLVYLFAGQTIFRLLTDNMTVVMAAGTYFPWVVLLPLVSFAAFIWDGIYVGATASVAMRNSMVIITLLIFLPSVYVLMPSMGNHGLWLAMILFMASRGVFLSAFARKAIFK